MEMTSRDEPPIQMETGLQPDASVIWLHGLGADGYDFEGLIPELRLPPFPAIRFIFPHANFRPVTLNGGYIMRAWYDIAMSERGFEQNLQHIRESEKVLRALIEDEIRRGIASERIVLAGFSQGGAMALHTGLRHPRKLAGILSLSAPVPYVESLMANIHPANAATPIFMAHGREDNLIPFDLAQQALRLMQECGLPVEWHAYAMGHSVVPDEIQDIARWLGNVLASKR